ncbi:MAG: helix-turn-helix transcriptional regulator [Ktedonobacteraceae bacterium]
MEGRTFWVDKHGNVYGPFTPQPDGFPSAGEVVQFYRVANRLSTKELAARWGVKQRWIETMEHDNTVPTNITRRRALASILGIPPFLLGLASLEDYFVKHEATAAAAPAFQQVRINTLDLSESRRALRYAWDLYYASDAESAREAVYHESARLERLATTSSTQQPEILDLLTHFDQLSINIAREMQDADSPRVKNSANRMVELAYSTANPDLIAITQHRRGMLTFETGDPSVARIDLEATVPFAERSQGSVKGIVLLGTGLTRAHAAQMQTDVQAAMKLIDVSGSIVRAGAEDADEYNVRFTEGWYHLTRAEALITLGRLDPSLYEQAFEALDLADEATPATFPRRHAYIDAFYAQASFDTGELDVAASTALRSLRQSQAVKSAYNIARLAKLYRQLAESKNKASKEVKLLGQELARSKWGK